MLESKKSHPHVVFCTGGTGHQTDRAVSLLMTKTTSSGRISNLVKNSFTLLNINFYTSFLLLGFCYITKVHTRRAVRGCMGGGGVNILEDARHWIGLLQYNPWPLRHRSRLGLPFSEKKIIPRNTEPTEILIHFVGILSVSWNAKRSEFRSESFGRRSKPFHR
jgi:hypothetical protein